MKLSHLVGLGAVVSAVVGWQLATPVATHEKTLFAAKSFRATIQVQPVGGTPATYTVAFAKPNLLRIDGPDGFVLSDGTTLYNYSKKGNVYTETPVSQADLIKATSGPEMWAWGAFFDPEFAKLMKTTKAGTERTLRGKKVTEVAFTMANERSGAGTLYVDKLLNVVFGYSLKTAEKEWLVFANDMKVTSDAAGLDFTFKAPEGAQKSESLKPAASYAEVAGILRGSCLACHSADRNSGGVQLANYEGAAAISVPGNPADSRLIKSVKGIGMNRMPKNRGPLSAETIATLEAWIAAGAKRD